MKQGSITNIKQVSIISFIFAISCFVTFGIIGSYVRADGVLVEPFALIPIGYFFLLISVIATTCILIKKLIKIKK